MELDHATYSHEDHEALDAVTATLIRDFSAVEPAVVARQVARAVAAVTWMGLSDDRTMMIETARARTARVSERAARGHRATGPSDTPP